MFSAPHNVPYIFVSYSPIRSLIESKFLENSKIGVNLFYGVRNLQRMAYMVGLIQY
jgi:predicted ferric reductase